MRFEVSGSLKSQLNRAGILIRGLGKHGSGDIAISSISKSTTCVTLVETLAFLPDNHHGGR